MQASSRIADFLSRLVLLTLVVGGLVAVFVLYWPLIRTNQIRRVEIARQEAEIQQLQREIQKMTAQANLYMENSNAVERLVRENLGYARPGEWIIHFSEKIGPDGTTPKGR